MKKILVIGESSRDVFVYCYALRLCPDVPVPVLNVIDQSENPGMAKNVQRNIKSLIGECDLLTNQNWYNITKTRYVHQKSNHTFFRVDSPHDIAKLNLDTIDYDYNIIAISDYDKGFLSEQDISQICKKHSNVFVDTKKVLGPWAGYAKYIKINDFEYKSSETKITSSLSDKIIHTMGSDGCSHRGKIYPVEKIEVKDVSGAGDTFMAGLVVKYFETQNIEQSIIFANKCASTVVKQKGVTSI